MEKLIKNWNALSTRQGWDRLWSKVIQLGSWLTWNEGPGVRTPRPNRLGCCSAQLSGAQNHQQLAWKPAPHTNSPWLTFASPKTSSSASRVTTSAAASV